MRLSSWNIIPYVHYPLSIFHYPLKKDCPQEDSTSYQYAHNDERSPYEIAVIFFFFLFRILDDAFHLFRSRIRQKIRVVVSSKSLTCHFSVHGVSGRLLCRLSADVSCRAYVLRHPSFCFFRGFICFLLYLLSVVHRSPDQSKL